MSKAAIVRPVLHSLPLTYRDPKAHRRPQITHACAFEYRAWIHVIRLGVRMHDPILLRDVRNVLCRALMDMELDVRQAEAEARAATQLPDAKLMVNSVTHEGKGVVGARFRVVAVDIGDNRVVVVVPAQQREISVELAEV